MTPKQVRAARALLGWSQADLAKEAGLGITTIADCELERRQTSFKALGVIREALERSGVKFTFGKQPGMRLGKR
jgi:DNA-binding XRE family transcriptional regulator